ncbi:unnamed protein product [Tuber aestivum]|uniref:DUF8035 domain-containing protein n=1 Tax=Tuber aestivum TaxID=59557 RepID=A0A292Q4I5_9PEZI|nr:unnamed protein product [Tuber aestivum]
MARYTTADPYLGERERQYLSDRDTQMAVYSPDAHFNSISTIAPYYANPHTSSGALVRSGLVEEPLVEHEHHHVHHHIDHGNPVGGGALAVRPRYGREYSYDDLYDRDRRYGSGLSLGSLGHHHHHGGRYGHRHHGLMGGRYARSDIDLNLGSFGHRRGSIYDRESELAIIDVPAGTRRVTVDMGRDIDISWRRDNGVRRSRGLGSELWTEITRDLVTREAIEDCGYPYEETEFFYYIFEYLHREQINELVDISYEIRRQRARDLEYDSIAGAGLGLGHSRLGGRIDYDYEDTRTEVIIDSGRHGHRRRNRYYH